MIKPKNLISLCRLARSSRGKRSRTLSQTTIWEVICVSKLAEYSVIRLPGTITLELPGEWNTGKNTFNLKRKKIELRRIY